MEMLGSNHRAGSLPEIISLFQPCAKDLHLVDASELGHRIKGGLDERAGEGNDIHAGTRCIADGAPIIRPAPAPCAAFGRIGWGSGCSDPARSGSGPRTDGSQTRGEDRCPGDTGDPLPHRHASTA